MAGIACTRRRRLVSMVSSTRASSPTLPKHIHGFNLTSSPLNHVCPRQPRSKRSSEPVPVYTSWSHSIQGLKTNQWPTRTTVLAQSWTGATPNGQSTWAMSTAAFSGDNMRSLCYDVVVFNWPRLGASLAVRNAKTWIREAWMDLGMVGHAAMPHGSDGDRFGGIPNSWATVEGLRWGMVLWARNKRAEQGGHSIYRGR
jgi:hypothetical protein